MRANLRTPVVCLALTMVMIFLVPPVLALQDESGSIDVLVYDSKGSPLRSILASIFGPVDERGIGSGTSDYAGSCETDSLGQCAIESVNAGRWSVSVRSHAGVISRILLGQAYGSVKQVIIVTGGKRTSVQFRLFPEAVIRGRVLTQDGKTVQGAYLDAEPDRLDGLTTAAESDGLGNYAIRGLITASYDVRARHLDSQEWTYRFGVPAVSGEILDGVDIILGVSETWTGSDSAITTSTMNTGESTKHFAQTTPAPLQESSFSSRPIIWGVLIGLFVSAPISIYRHMNSRRRTTRRMWTGRRMLTVSRRRWLKYVTGRFRSPARLRRLWQRIHRKL